MARFGNHFVHLEAGQLTAFAWLRPLSNLNLYLFCIHQVLRGNSEAPRRHLLGLAGERNPVDAGMETLVVLAALAGIRTSPQLIHR